MKVREKPCAAQILRRDIAGADDAYAQTLPCGHEETLPETMKALSGRTRR
jgi:hypothetical protein